MRDTVDNRPWFRFSLRSRFVAVALTAIIGYLVAARAKVHWAQDAYRRASAGWEGEMVPTPVVCQASLDLLNAELGFPLTNRAKSAAEHLQRIERIKKQIDYFASCGLSGGGTPEMAQLQAEVNAYYVAAQRRVSQTRKIPFPGQRHAPGNKTRPEVFP